jgi:ribonuclease-3
LEELDSVLVAVEDLLGYKFSDRHLLMQSLCHKSYANERGWPLIEANERLEFLGDSVVELAVTHLLFEDFPDYAEGELTKLRAPMVRGVALAEAAERMGMGAYILLGKGEEVTGGRNKRSILAGTFEAVVGALYLDGGFDVARGMVISCLEPTFHDIMRLGIGDHKSELQELAAKRFGSVPKYRYTEEGPDHYKTFYATVEVGGNEFGPVPGPSKKEAEQGAARVAMSRLAPTGEGRGGLGGGQDR